MSQRVQALALADPRVAATWRRLQAAGGVGSPFLVWELFSALADVPELSGDMRVLVVDDGQRPLGLLPVEQRDGPRGLPTLGLAPPWLGADHLRRGCRAAAPAGGGRGRGPPPRRQDRLAAAGPRRARRVGRA